MNAYTFSFEYRRKKTGKIEISNLIYYQKSTKQNIHVSIVLRKNFSLEKEFLKKFLLEFNCSHITPCKTIKSKHEENKPTIKPDRPKSRKSTDAF